MEIKKNAQSYLMPFIIMVVLMSLIGLITNLNQQFQGPMQAAYLLKAGGLKNMLTTMLVFSFFLAYLVMGPITNKYIDKNGYKKSLIFGLFILIAAFGLYELSAWVFETFDKANFIDTIEKAKAAEIAKTPFEYTGPVTVPYAYYIFLLAAFVAGTALTYLQAVVNPYIVACEVKGTSGVQRQSIAGAGNSTMTTIGPLLVASLIFGGASGLNISISSLYIPILALIVMVAIIIVALTKIHLPSIASAEKKEGEVLEKSVWSFSHLSLGVIAIFMYVGVEVCVGSNINLFAMSDGGFTLETAAKLASMYWGGMLIGRLCGSFLSKISANVQLLVTSVGAGILVALAMITNNPWLLVGVGLFHSIMWPAIFSLAIDKLGKYTSAGTGALMMGVVGGAVLPLIQGVAADHIGWQYTWAIVLAAEAYLLYYALIGYKVKQLPE